MFGPRIVQYFVFFSGFGIISLRKREVVALLLLSSGYYVAIIFLCLFLKVHWVVLWCVIVAIPVTPTCLFIFLHFP